MLSNLNFILFFVFWLLNQLNFAEEFDKSLSHMFGIDHDVLVSVIHK